MRGGKSEREIERKERERKREGGREEGRERERKREGETDRQRDRERQRERERERKRKRASEIFSYTCICITCSRRQYGKSSGCSRRVPLRELPLGSGEDEAVEVRGHVDVEVGPAGRRPGRPVAANEAVRPIEGR